MLQTQSQAQLGVVAQLGVRVQGQVVGQQIDVVGQQQADPLLHPAGDAPIHAAPEQAVMHEDGIGPGLDRSFDQGATGRHTADDAANLALAFDLQAVGPVVLEAFGLQQAIKLGQKVVSQDHGPDCAHAAVPAGTRPLNSQALHRHIAGTKKGSRSCPDLGEEKRTQALATLGCQP